MTPFPEQEELRALLDALCEERITPAEIARLEELVLTRPEAEAYYVQYIGMFAELSTTLSTSAALNERAPQAATGGGRTVCRASVDALPTRTRRQFSPAGGSWLAAMAAVLACAARSGGPLRGIGTQPDRVSFAAIRRPRRRDGRRERRAAR